MSPTVTNFLDQIRPAAQAVEAQTGIPWLFAATQAAHESRWGLSRLTVDANNLFGMTADPDSAWVKAGKPFYQIRTQEYDANKQPYFIVRGFRRYVSWTESLADWAGLIQRRYHDALAAAQRGDFYGFAQGLQSGGYATDPHYAIQLAMVYGSIKDLA